MQWWIISTLAAVLFIWFTLCKSLCIKSSSQIAKQYCYKTQLLRHCNGWQVLRCRLRTYLLYPEKVGEIESISSTSDKLKSVCVTCGYGSLFCSSAFHYSFEIVMAPDNKCLLTKRSLICFMDARLLSFHGPPLGNIVYNHIYGPFWWGLS